MIFDFLKTTNYIPIMCVKTVFDIDYIKLYAEGKRIMLFDLDNTLIPYDIDIANEKINNLISDLKQYGFKVAIISNNKHKRVAKFSTSIDVPYVNSAKKPFKTGFKKVLRNFENVRKEEVVCIGDQLLTDVLGSSRYEIDCILVRPIKKSSEKWYTRFNRYYEKKILTSLKKKNHLIYKDIEENYGD